MFEEIDFDERGLVPCVVQDEASAEVLLLAYVNEKALEMTLETGEMHFFSRSRDEIWRKGETSGATMAVRQLRYDCDGDADPGDRRAGRRRLPHRRAHLLLPRDRWLGRARKGRAARTR